MGTATQRKTITYTTAEVVLRLGTSYSRIIGAITRGKISAPQTDSSGRMTWKESDIETLRAALSIDRRRREHRRKEVRDAN